MNAAARRFRDRDVGSKIALLAIVAVLAVGAGIGAWVLVREQEPLRPEISAYSDGHSTRVGAYRYRSVLDLTDCQNGGLEGELRVNRMPPCSFRCRRQSARRPGGY